MWYGAMQHQRGKNRDYLLNKRIAESPGACQVKFGKSQAALYCHPLQRNRIQYNQPKQDVAIKTIFIKNRMSRSYPLTPKQGDYWHGVLQHILTVHVKSQPSKNKNSCNSVIGQSYTTYRAYKHIKSTLRELNVTCEWQEHHSRREQLKRTQNNNESQIQFSCQILWQTGLNG